MKALRSFLARHPVSSYFGLTLAISWGAVLLTVGGTGAFPASPEEGRRLLPVAVSVMLLGPSVAGFLMTRLVHGGAGIRELLAGFTRWRAGPRWYAVALLSAPLAAAGTLLALLPTSAMFLPAIAATDDRLLLLVSAIGVGLAAGAFEEPGWTGFATPTLRRRHGVMATGIIVGLMWGAWHLIVAAWGSGDDEGAFSPALFLAQFLFYAAVLPAYRVLMVWVVDRTASLLVAVLMHASLTGSVLFVLMPPASSAASLIAWYLAIAVALWAAVAAVAVANRGHWSRGTALRKVA